MAAISEQPRAWRSGLQKWRTLNRRHKTRLEEEEAPDANEEYLFYQILLGTWPLQANGEPAPEVDGNYIERIQAYMAKALKEAKLNTSWIQPNEAWDNAVGEFIAKAARPGIAQQLVPRLSPVCRRAGATGGNQLTQRRPSGN